jgi:hypothetical protein
LIGICPGNLAGNWLGKCTFKVLVKSPVLSLRCLAVVPIRP